MTILDDAFSFANVKVFVQQRYAVVLVSSIVEKELTDGSVESGQDFFINEACGGPK